MKHQLLDAARSELDPAAFLAAIGTRMRVFDQQDSGNLSYGVHMGRQLFFVKTAGDPADTAHYLSHTARVALLHNAIELHQSVQHPALIPLLHVVESPHGPMLVYPWFAGELLGVRRAERDDPRSSYQRFRALPPDEIGACLDTLYDLHAQLGTAGWVAHDLYDGCLMYDFARRTLAVIDLDTYQRGSFVNTMGRMFGSTRFMAPEEFRRGATIDQRTTVFTLGRMALVLLGNGSGDQHAFRGSALCFEVALRACADDPAERYADIGAFAGAWQAARRASRLA